MSPFMITCPECTQENPDTEKRCVKCRLDLDQALAHHELFVEKGLPVPPPEVFIQRGLPTPEQQTILVEQQAAAFRSQEILSPTYPFGRRTWIGLRAWFGVSVVLLVASLIVQGRIHSWYQREGADRLDLYGTFLNLTWLIPLVVSAVALTAVGIRAKVERAAYATREEKRRDLRIGFRGLAIFVVLLLLVVNALMREDQWRYNPLFSFVIWGLPSLVIGAGLIHVGMKRRWIAFGALVSLASLACVALVGCCLYSG